MAEFRARRLAEDFYSLGKDAPLPAHLKNQFLRSASSVALNLVEGNGKSSLKDRLRIFEIARGSFLESMTILRLEKITDKPLLEVADRLGANLYNLNKSLNAKLKTQGVKSF